MAAFSIHNFIHVDEDVGQLNPVDEAACNRVLELFATPYHDLTTPQIIMLERIRDASKSAQIPFRHIFNNEQTDDMPLANILHLNGSSELHPLRNLAPYLKATKSQHETGHTVPDSVSDQMRTLWNVFCDMREDHANHIYTQQDVLDFVEWSNILVEDPNVGITLVSRQGGEHHVKYDNEQHCFVDEHGRWIARFCLTPGCFSLEYRIISELFPHCLNHYNNAVHVVMEISKPDATHPHRHVKFQMTIDRRWNNDKLMYYIGMVWQRQRPSYRPVAVSSVTQAWIFDTHQPAVDKIACLQFCHTLKALNDSSYEYVTDQITLPINLQDQIGPMLNDLGITISLNGLVSDDELESIGLSGLFGVEFSEDALKGSKIVLYRSVNDHFEYRGLTTDWLKRSAQRDVTLASKSMFWNCTERGHQFTHEPRRILLGKERMEKAEFLTIMGSAIMAYIHAPRPESGMDFVNVNVVAQLVDRGPNNNGFQYLETYESTDMDEDYCFELEGLFYDDEHFTDLDLLQQWIANEYRVKVIITVKPDVVLDEEELAFLEA